MDSGGTVGVSLVPLNNPVQGYPNRTPLRVDSDGPTPLLTAYYRNVDTGDGAAAWTTATGGTYAFTGGWTMEMWVRRTLSGGGEEYMINYRDLSVEGAWHDFGLHPSGASPSIRPPWTCTRTRTAGEATGQRTSCPFRSASGRISCTGAATATTRLPCTRTAAPSRAARENSVVIAGSPDWASFGGVTGDGSNDGSPGFTVFTGAGPQQASFRFRGEIAFARFYGYPLTAEQVRDNFLSTLGPGPAPNPLSVFNAAVPGTNVNACVDSGGTAGVSLVPLNNPGARLPQPHAPASGFRRPDTAADGLLPQRRRQ